MVISPYFTQKNLEANRNDDQSNKLGDSPTRTGNFMVCVYTYIVNNIIDIMSRGIQKNNKSCYDFYGTFLWAQKQQKQLGQRWGPREASPRALE